MQELPGDLFSLAQTVATLTGGLVTIEDTANHVLAYSESVDEADELRRLSILGRNCPPSYLELLREWGVFQRMRSGDDVVAVEARPELGVRARLVIGVTAGSRQLGGIWVQEGTGPLAERSAEVLRGAARLAARQLIDFYYRGDASARRRSREDLAYGLLTGRFNAAALAAHLGVHPGSAATVVAVDLREAPGEDDASWLELRRAEAAEIISVHAAAYRRHSLVTQACGQIYVMLPEPPAGSSGSPGSSGPSAPKAEEPVQALGTWISHVVVALRRHTGTPVQAAVADVAASLEDVPAAKERAYELLNVVAADPDRLVATQAELRAPLVLRDVLETLRPDPRLRHPGLDRLVRHDAEQGSELVRSLLLYLDAFGDVGRAAKELHVHPNTLRHRVRRAATLAGIDLGDPDERLVALLLLRLAAPAGH